MPPGKLSGSAPPSAPGRAGGRARRGAALYGEVFLRLYPSAESGNARAALLPPIEQRVARASVDGRGGSLCPRRVAGGSTPSRRRGPVARVRCPGRARDAAAGRAGSAARTAAGRVGRVVRLRAQPPATTSAPGPDGVPQARHEEGRPLFADIFAHMVKATTGGDEDDALDAYDTSVDAALSRRAQRRRTTARTSRR